MLAMSFHGRTGSPVRIWTVMNFHCQNPFLKDLYYNSPLCVFVVLFTRKCAGHCFLSVQSHSPSLCHMVYGSSVDHSLTRCWVGEICQTSVNIATCKQTSLPLQTDHSDLWFINEQNYHEHWNNLWSIHAFFFFALIGYMLWLVNLPEDGKLNCTVWPIVPYHAYQLFALEATGRDFLSQWSLTYHKPPIVC